jgi:hypothetical protein
MQGDRLQTQVLFFAPHAMEVATMDWAHWIKPGEIQRAVRAALVMLRRMRSPTEVLMDVADVTSMMMRPRESFVAARIVRPQRRMRASGLVERHLTEK